uniref:Uncharacterized protein n=1 Tax=Siphoviridae sp. cto3L1 TaxID=2827942 RepID=A0A8S5SQS9_9CAUD|nr:MAG TPA: hypothetical protein [Siphoviridae sp. cto3L1]
MQQLHRCNQLNCKKYKMCNRVKYTQRKRVFDSVYLFLKAAAGFVI